MRSLNTLDVSILCIYLIIIFGVGLYFSRKASQSTDHFFVGNRGLPWWLLGISMAATNYSIDTPLAISKIVLKDGIAGVWFWWAGALSALLVAFLFARLWRRAAVVTDAEIVEIRYGGPSAAFLRLFKGFYFGVFFNIFIMAWVFLALNKVLVAITDVPSMPLLIIATTLAFIYTVTSGIYGVIVTDFLQYALAAAGAIGISVYAVLYVGGLESFWGKLSDLPSGMSNFTAFGGELGSFLGEEGLMMPSSVFLAYITMKWWAHKWADGGGKHIQRMLSARDEKHAMWATLFFAFNATLVVWPWIITALCAQLTFDHIPDPEMAYPRMMALSVPHGLLGLSVACLAGAFMSTIDTHLNLGASYMINDLYRRFWVTDESEKHYILMARLCMVFILISSVTLSFFMDSVADAWRFLITFAGGAGLTWILRWFWWRMNAWSELSAMCASGCIATYVQWAYPELAFGYKLMSSVFGAACVWIPVTLFTAPVAQDHLIKFVQRVQPGRLGWDPIYQVMQFEDQPYLLRALGKWLCVVIVLFSLNFAIGSLLLGQLYQACILAIISLCVGIISYPIIRYL